MRLDDLITKATCHAGRTVAIAAAEDEEVIDAVKMAIEYKLASFFLFGKKERIEHLLRQKGFTPTEYRAIKVIDTKERRHSAEEAVKAVSAGRADVLMKGMVPTAVLLKEVLSKTYGLRSGHVLSHVAAFEIEGCDRLILITDSAMNIAPDIDQKVQIIQNSVKVAHAIGIEKPKVAPLAAVEVVNPAMPATIDADLLSQMNKRGQIDDCIIEGPLALDNAISLEAAKLKGIQGQVPGFADILMVPTIEVGNILYKSLVYFANAKVGAIIAGATVPIVLTSRADSAESKLYSLALALCSVAR